MLGLNAFTQGDFLLILHKNHINCARRRRAKFWGLLWEMGKCRGELTKIAQYCGKLTFLKKNCKFGRGIKDLRKTCRGIICYRALQKETLVKESAVLRAPEKLSKSLETGGRRCTLDPRIRFLWAEMIGYWKTNHWCRWDTEKIPPKLHVLEIRLCWLADSWFYSVRCIYQFILSWHTLLFSLLWNHSDLCVSKPVIYRNIKCIGTACCRLLVEHCTYNRLYINLLVN